MDGRQWPQDREASRDGQFARAPESRDGHGSDHLPTRGRLRAAWHGLSRVSQVVIVASVVAFSTAGGTSIAFTLDEWGREVGTQPQAHGPVAAHDDAPDGLAEPGRAADPLRPGLAADNSSGGLVNGTAGQVPAAPSPEGPGPGS